MNQIELNAIVEKTFKDIEADVVMVFFNEENGVKVWPIWEHSCKFKTAEEMYDSVEKEFITNLIKFADESGGGDNIGAYALEWKE